MEHTHVVIILAAGAGRRYGGAKQLALIDGEPMLYRVVRQCKSPERYHTLVVLGAYAEEIRDAVKELEVEIVENAEWEEGVASSIRAGVQYVIDTYPGVDGILMMLGDQYKLTRDHILQYFDAAGTGTQIIATEYHGVPGVPAYFPKREWQLLLTLQGDEGAQRLLTSMTNIVLLEMPDAQSDLDFPDMV